MPRVVETLIRNAYVVTVDAGRRVYTDGYVAFDRGRIVAVGPMTACQLTATETLDARGKLVMPGIANGHNHLNQIAFRGYNDDRWPVTDIPRAVTALLAQLFRVASRLDEARSYVLTRLHALELIKAGYTATHDEHFTNVDLRGVDGSWAALTDSGMRGFVARCIVNSEGVPPSGREDVDAGLAEVERLRAKFGSSRIEVVPGILNYNFLGDPEDMRRIGAGARAMGARLDIDMTDNSRGANLRARGFAGGQVDYYRSFDLLEAPLYAGKAVNLLPHEYALLRERDARVALVPVLRFFDGMGLPLHHLLGEGMLPGIGTDAPLVSDSQNPFEVMRLVILAQNIAIKREIAAGGSAPDASLYGNAETLIEMATLGGARTLFMEEEAGSLSVGKAADCIIIDWHGAALAPGWNGRRAIGSLVWGGGSGIVDSVFVAGKRLLAGGRSTVWDEETVVREAEAVVSQLATETGLDEFLPPRRPSSSYRGWRYV